MRKQDGPANLESRSAPFYHVEEVTNRYVLVGFVFLLASRARFDLSNAYPLASLSLCDHTGGILENIRRTHCSESVTSYNRNRGLSISRE